MPAAADRIVALLLLATALGTALACGTAADCGGQGTCDALGGCVCNPGWVGSDCRTAASCDVAIDPLILSYSLFVFGDYTVVTGSRVSGLVAVGGNAFLQNFSIGDTAPLAADPKPFSPPSIRDDLVVSGIMSAISGAVLSGGNIVYGVDQFLSQRVSVANAGAKLQGQVIDFAARSAGLALLQNSIAALPITGTASSSWGSLTLISTSHNAVFLVPDSYLTSATSITLSVPSGASVVITSVSSNPSVAIASLALFGSWNTASAGSVLWNLVGFDSVTVNNIELYGTLIAGTAQVDFASGTIYGGIIAESVLGDGVILATPFTACVKQDPSPSSTPTITPPVSATSTVSLTKTSTPSRSVSLPPGSVPSPSSSASIGAPASPITTASVAPAYSDGIAPSGVPASSGAVASGDVSASQAPAGDTGGGVSSAASSAGPAASGTASDGSASASPLPSGTIPAGGSVEYTPSPAPAQTAGYSAAVTATGAVTPVVSGAATPAVSGAVTPAVSRVATPSILPFSSGGMFLCDAPSFNASSNFTTRPTSSISQGFSLSCASSATVSDDNGTAAPTVWSCVNVADTPTWQPSNWNTTVNGAAPSIATLRCAAPSTVKCAMFGSVAGGSVAYSQTVLSVGTTAQVACPLGQTVCQGTQQSTLSAASLTCSSGGMWTSATLDNASMPAAGYPVTTLSCLSTESSLAITKATASVCVHKSHPWNSDVYQGSSGKGTAVGATLTVFAICVVGLASEAIRNNNRVVSRVKAALLPIGGGGQLAYAPALVWLVLDALFRCAAYADASVPWNKAGLADFRGFVGWFAWTSPVAAALWFVLLLFAAFIAVVARVATPVLSRQGRLTHSMSQVLPSTASVSSVSVGTRLSPWQTVVVSTAKATAGVLFLPFAYVLLQPWLCPFASSTNYFVTSECGNALKCWSGSHIFSLVLSGVVLAAMFLVLIRADFDLLSLAHWTTPHFLAVTLSSRLLLAWSGRILLFFSPCASCFLSLYLNTILALAGGVFAFVQSSSLPTWLLAVGAALEVLILAYGLTAVGVVMNSSVGCSSALGLWIVFTIGLIVAVGLGWKLLLKVRSRDNKPVPSAVDDDVSLFSPGKPAEPRVAPTVSQSESKRALILSQDDDIADFHTHSDSDEETMGSSQQDEHTKKRLSAVEECTTVATEKTTMSRNGSINSGMDLSALVEEAENAVGRVHGRLGSQQTGIWQSRDEGSVRRNFIATATSATTTTIRSSIRTSGRFTYNLEEVDEEENPTAVAESHFDPQDKPQLLTVKPLPTVALGPGVASLKEDQTRAPALPDIAAKPVRLGAFVGSALGPLSSPALATLPASRSSSHSSSHSSSRSESESGDYALGEAQAAGEEEEEEEEEAATAAACSDDDDYPVGTTRRSTDSRVDLRRIQNQSRDSLRANRANSIASTGKPPSPVYLGAHKVQW